jgi:hypothetical protein
MAIDFPNSPTSNQIYTSGGRSWIWNGSSWVAYTTTITTDLIANGTITSAMIANGTISSIDLANDAVTQAKLADRVVGSAEYDNMTLNAQTGTSYTLVLTDAHKMVTLSNSSPITLTIPTEASVAFENGDQVNLLQLGSGQVTVSGGVSVTVRSQGSKLKLNGQYAGATLMKIGTDEWVIIGNTAA